MRVPLERYDSPHQITVPSAVGPPQTFTAEVEVEVNLGGETFRLEPVLEEGVPEDELFFIFGDLTNGVETYGGGRFLYGKLNQDGTVSLDFNEAYNPPCAFTAHATCPLPPPENRLAVRIEAGEKTYAKH